MPDRPAHREAPDSELEITPEMVEVGEQGLEVAVAEGPDGDAWRLLVAGGPEVVGVGLGGWGLAMAGLLRWC